MPPIMSAASCGIRDSIPSFAEWALSSERTTKEFISGDDTCKRFKWLLGRPNEMGGVWPG